MKIRMTNLKIVSTFLAMALILVTNWGEASAWEISGRIKGIMGDHKEGITVELTGTMTDTTTTNNMGQYGFFVPNGEYTVTPIGSPPSQEFDPPSRDVTVNNADVPNQDFNALYHHVDSCNVCHNMGGATCDNEYGVYDNLSRIACTIETPNSGPMLVKFIATSGPAEVRRNGSTPSTPSALGVI